MTDLDEWVNDVHTGDALNLLTELPRESVHAVITDPPYGLAFMGRDWDDFEPKEYQEWTQEWAEKARRVLRPGGHLLAFSGNRTHHRLFSGVEDAGFEVRDTLTWHYGSGFPKALDVSKAIDKQAGVEPESVSDAEGVGFMNSDDDGWNDTHNHIKMGEPTTDSAKAWDGWKTALKPSTEFIALARKPLSENTVAENVQAHGTGALNVDGCRVGTEERENAPPGENDIYEQAEGGHGTVEGRYPANAVFDEAVAEQLDQEVGQCYSASGEYGTEGGDEALWGSGDSNQYEGHDAHGGPSRYFYTSKASRSERTLNGKIQNPHPTVKPLDLMEWLTKLATAEGQIILDPFTGTGTTLRAAKNHGRQFIGIEKQEKWADIARARTGLTPQNPDRLTDEQQTTLQELPQN